MLKQFNLQEALNGAKVVTRNGLDGIKIYQHDPNNAPYSKIVGSYQGIAMGWSEDGTFRNDGEESIYDLFIEIPDTEIYINLYGDEHGTWVDEHTYSSESEAKESAQDKYIATYKLNNNEKNK